MSVLRRHEATAPRVMSSFLPSALLSPLVCLTIMTAFNSQFSNVVAALSATPPSPWAPSPWRITLNFGREPSTTMPKSWGESGGRLVLPVDVLIESDRVSRDDSVIGGDAKPSRLQPILGADGTYPTFVNTEGEQTVEIGEEGGWRISLPPGGGKTGRASSLNFYLDILTKGACRNDVTIPAERIYFVANCWREKEFSIGRRAIEPIQRSYHRAQQKLEKRLDHDTGDRRLDGTDPLDTIVAYGDMAELVRNRDDKLYKLKEAEKLFPANAEEIPKGAWPGATEWLAVSPKGGMAIRKKKMFGEEFQIVGTWTASPL